MEIPRDITLDRLTLLFATMWPGLLSLVIYRARVPGPAVAWKDSFIVAAFCTGVNYILLYPAPSLFSFISGTVPWSGDTGGLVGRGEYTHIEFIKAPGSEAA